MKLRNLFCLLAALPLVFASCEKGGEDVDKTPEQPDTEQPGTDEPGTDEPGTDEPAQPVTVTALGFGGYYVSGAEEELDVDNYFFALTDKALTGEGDMPDGAVVYWVDLYLEAYEGEWKEFMPLPVGEYTLSEQEYVAGTFFKEGSVYLADSSTDDIVQFEAGKLVVTEAGLTLTVTIEGVEHTVTYEGAMNLLNDSKEPVEVREVNVDYAHAYYNGDMDGTGVSDNFTLILSDVDVYNDGLWAANAEHYRFELYSTQIDKTAGIAIPYGTYMLDGADSKAANTIHSDSVYMLIDSYCEDYEQMLSYDAAYITVAESGITAEIVLAGETIEVVFEGTVSYEDCSSDYVPGTGDDEEEQDSLSTLTGDLNFNLTGASFVIGDYGYYANGANNYILYVYENEDAVDIGGGDYLMLDLLVASDAANLAGEYAINDTEMPYTSFPGDPSMDWGCWYVDMDSPIDEVTEMNTVMAPIVEGTLKLDIAADGTYTLTFTNCYDDADNAITGTITGTLYGSGSEDGGNEDGGSEVNPYHFEIAEFVWSWIDEDTRAGDFLLKTAPDANEEYKTFRLCLSHIPADNKIPDGTYSSEDGTMIASSSYHLYWDNNNGCAMASVTATFTTNADGITTINASWIPNNGSNQTYTCTWVGEMPIYGADWE